LRMSGERAAKMVTDAADWKTLTYAFKMPALAEVELICEFRASSGRARFDAESLKLIRHAISAKQASSPPSSSTP
jgi:hypothetical protein